jgi:hypothetical protein
MNMFRSTLRRAICALALVFAVASPAFAQSATDDDAALLKQISRSVSRNITYPSMLNNQSLSAVIVFTVQLDENSRVKNINFESKTPMHEDILYYFVRSATEGIQRSNFQGLTGTVELPVRFQRGL